MKIDNRITTSQIISFLCLVQREIPRIHHYIQLGLRIELLDERGLKALQTGSDTTRSKVKHTRTQQMPPGERLYRRTVVLVYVLMSLDRFRIGFVDNNLSTTICDNDADRWRGESCKFENAGCLGIFLNGRTYRSLQLGETRREEVGLIFLDSMTARFN